MRALCFGFLVLGLSAAHGHDLSSLDNKNNLKNKLPPDVRKKLDAARASRQALRPSIFPVLLRSRIQSIYRYGNAWDAGQTLTVCFWGGDQALRERIATIASEWTQYGKLALDFSSPPRTCNTEKPSNIRVSFAGSGYESYVGIENTLIPGDLPTMNLQGFDVLPPSEKRFRFLVLHEFGHALSFEHEHQSPAGGCEKEFIPEKVKELYGWNDKQYLDNMTTFKDSSAYSYSTYDPDSVMHYALEKEIFKAGASSRCYVAEKNALSAADKKGMARAYPSGDPGRVLGNQYRDVVQVLSTSTLNIQQRSALEARRDSIVDRSMRAMTH